LTRYSDAENELRAALATYEPKRREEPMPLAEVERVLGEVSRELNRYDEAETLMLDALALARSGLPDRDPELVVFLGSLAGFYKDQARYDEAELLVEEGIGIRTEAGLGDQLAIPTLNLAEIYRLQGRYDDAIPRYQRAIAIAQKTLPPLEVAEFHNQIASAYADMGRPKDAETQFRQALAVADSATDASPQIVAQFKNDLGVLLAREGRVDEGEKYLKEAIALREGVFGPNHPLVAVCLTQLARAEAGLFDESRVKPTPRDKDAAMLLERALAILDSTDAEPEARVDARVARAQLYYRDRHVDHAAATMAKALEDVEALRPHRGGGGAERIEFIRRYVDAYDRMTSWQVELGKPSSALDYSERRRARVLVDRLTGTTQRGVSDESRAALERLRADKRDLEKQLGKCQSQAQALRDKSKPTKSERTELATIESRCDRIVGDIERIGERIRRLESGESETPAPAARPRVAKGEALLVYHIGTESSFLFVLDDGSKEVRAYALDVSSAAGAQLGLRSGALTRASVAQLLTGYDASGKTIGVGILRQLAEPVQGAATSRAQQSMYERLHALFTVLVPAAVWPTIKSAREVTIIPDGPLSAFPFEACVVSEKQDAPRYWLDDGPVVRYAPSIATLAALASAAKRKSTDTVLTVCNPRYATTSGALAPLPGTARETETVVSAFGKDRVTVLCGEAATEAAVRRSIPGKEIVHLATHGLVSQRQSDLLASLAFTPVASPQRDLRDDGFLQLFEIYELALSAELVVLSACESSTGSYVLGEGVMALSRGFLSAGARRVVATQWKVDDDATAALVGDFLTRIAKAERAGGEVDFALALRDAKRAARQSTNWSQPFYWAAFVVTGAE
jgi:CHAT domain-containing protein/tetratricopeptide (TPR) repeat protein